MDDPAAIEVRDASVALQSGAMQLLLGWSAANLAGGGLGAALADDRETRAFLLGSAAWNTVNLGIALGSLASLPAQRDRTDPAQIGKAARNLETALLVNGGLDLVYVGSGLGLTFGGKRAGREDLRGYGEALVLQGAFLLVFDATTWARHRAVSAPLR